MTGNGSIAETLVAGSPPAARSLRANILINVAGQVFVLAVTLLATRAVFGALGPAEFGLLSFTLVASLLLATALDLGVSTTIVREVASQRGSDRIYVRGVIQTAALLYWGGYALAAIALWLAAPALSSSFLHLGSGFNADPVSAVRILGLAGLLALPRTCYASVCRGLERFDVANGIDVASLGLQQAGVIAIVVGGGGLHAVALWVLTTFVINVAMYAGAVAWLLSPRVLVPAFRGDVVRRNRRFGGELIGISVLAALQAQLDKVLAARLLLISLVGEYGVVASILQRATIISSAVAQAALPSFSAAAGRGDLENARARLRRLQAVLCLGGAVLFTTAVLLAPPVLSVVLSPAAASDVVVPTAVLAIGYMMNTTLTLPYVFSLAVDRAQITLRSNLIAAVLVPPLAIVMIGRWGLTGAALTWVWYHVIAYVYAVPRLARDVLGESPSAWFGATAALVLPAVAIDAIALICLSAAGALQSLAALAALALALLAYAGSLWFLAQVVRVPAAVAVLTEAMRAFSRPSNDAT